MWFNMPIKRCHWNRSKIFALITKSTLKKEMTSLFKIEKNLRIDLNKIFFMILKERTSKTEGYFLFVLGIGGE